MCDSSPILLWNVFGDTSYLSPEVRRDPLQTFLPQRGSDEGRLTTPPPNLEEVWGRIKVGAKRADQSEKSKWGFCCPPLNPLPQSGRGVCG